MPSSQRLWVILGRAGDVLSQLPFLYHEHQKTNELQRVMVAREFSDLLDGCSYVERVVYDGSYRDLGKAVELARSLASEVVITSLHGSKQDMEQLVYKQVGQTHATTSCFQKEQWKLAGKLDLWDDNLPLVFDRRDKEREKRLLTSLNLHKQGQKRKPIILVSVKGGVTAPFPYADLLMFLLESKFSKTHRIIELPMVEQPEGRIYDLLALYEQASLLIATDSQPLHLAWACPSMPVFALANDKPNYWAGACWRPNHLWFCRYSDFPVRAVEMVRAVVGLSEYHPRRGDSELVRTWLNNGKLKTTPAYCWVPIERGMCVESPDGFPSLKDAIRMSIQRSGLNQHEGSQISITRPGVRPTSRIKLFHVEQPKDKPFYAYRIKAGTYYPIVDLFSASRAFWKRILPQIPEMWMDDGHLWSNALWAIFKANGAVDCTGACEYLEEEKE